MAISLHLGGEQTQIPGHRERIDLESVLDMIFWMDGEQCALGGAEREHSDLIQIRDVNLSMPKRDNA